MKSSCLAFTTIKFVSSLFYMFNNNFKICCKHVDINLISLKTIIGY